MIEGEETRTTAIVVRKDDSGALMLPMTSDIVSDAYAEALIAWLDEHPTRWVGLLADILCRPTPSEWIEWREGPMTNKGPLMLAYIEGSKAKLTRQAIAKVGIASDFEVVQTDVTPEEVDCLGRLTFKYGSQTVTAMQWGRAMRHSGVALGDTKKGAATDAEKKCLNEFGWGMDVYTTEAAAPVPPTPEEMRAKSLEVLYNIGQRAGLTRDDVDEFVSKATKGKRPEELEPADLTSIKRRLEKAIREKVDAGTKTS